MGSVAAFATSRAARGLPSQFFCRDRSFPLGAVKFSFPCDISSAKDITRRFECPLSSAVTAVLSPTCPPDVGISIRQTLGVDLLQPYLVFRLMKVFCGSPVDVSNSAFSFKTTSFGRYSQCNLLQVCFRSCTRFRYANTLVHRLE